MFRAFQFPVLDSTVNSIQAQLKRGWLTEPTSWIILLAPVKLATSPSLEQAVPTLSGCIFPRGVHGSAPSLYLPITSLFPFSLSLLQPELLQQLLSLLSGFLTGLS